MPSEAQRKAVGLGQQAVPVWLYRYGCAGYLHGWLHAWLVTCRAGFLECRRGYMQAVMYGCRMPDTRLSCKMQGGTRWPSSYEQLQLTRRELSAHSSVLCINIVLKYPWQHHSTEEQLQLLNPCAEQHDVSDYASQPACWMGPSMDGVLWTDSPSSCMPSCAMWRH